GLNCEDHARAEDLRGRADVMRRKSNEMAEAARSQPLKILPIRGDEALGAFAVFFLRKTGLMKDRFHVRQCFARDQAWCHVRSDLRHYRLVAAEIKRIKLALVG